MEPFNRDSKNPPRSYAHNFVLFTGTTVAAALLMAFTSPEANTAVVAIWFSLVGVGIYNLLQIIGNTLSGGWSFIQSLIYSTALVALTALSTLNQLTFVDVVAVLVLAGFAQLIYRVQKQA